MFLLASESQGLHPSHEVFSLLQDRSVTLTHSQPFLSSCQLSRKLRSLRKRICLKKRHTNIRITNQAVFQESYSDR